MKLTEQDEHYIGLVKECLCRAKTQLDARAEFLLYADRYQNVPKDIKERILGIPELEYDLENNGGDIKRMILDIGGKMYMGREGFVLLRKFVEARFPELLGMVEVAELLR